MGRLIVVAQGPRRKRDAPESNHSKKGPISMDDGDGHGAASFFQAREVQVNARLRRSRVDRA
jgi:hypothetical protein